ncbi:MAG TPA: GNAT family N-acetyltransferase [Devosiaceae bacterium]|nr:GNAT family N-acetyltransferase [Devosiaceae bacterium]
MTKLDIKCLSSSPACLAALCDLLVEAVASGASVSFMHPLATEAAEAFWNKSFAASERGERVILGAYYGDELVGTASLVLDFPVNQPHRAEIAKVMTKLAYRGHGIATALLRKVEMLAAERGRTLIVLDTAAEDGAAPFYEKLGYTRLGEIPDYGLKPHGGLTGTILFWKRIASEAGAA